MSGPGTRRGMPASFWLLWTGNLINMLGGVVEVYLLLYLVTRQGFSPGDAGVVVALLGAGAVLAQLLGGYSADRLGRRVTMLASTWVQAVSVLWLGAAESNASIYTAACLVGISREMYRPALTALVSDLVPVEQHRRAYGLIYWSVNLGWVVAVPLGGWLAQVDFGWLFRLDAASCFLFGVLVLVGVSKERPRALGSRQIRFADLRTAASDRLFLAYLVVVALYTMVSLQGMTTLSLAMHALGYSTGEFGAAMAVNGVVVVVAQPLLARHLERINARYVIILGFCLVGAGYGATSLAQDVVGIAATIFVWSVGEVVAAAALVSTAVAMAPARLKGQYSGMYGASWSIGLLLAPIFGTQLLPFGPAALWGACTLVCLALTVAYALLDRRLKRRV